MSNKTQIYTNVCPWNTDTAGCFLVKQVATWQNPSGCSVVCFSGFASVSRRISLVHRGHPSLTSSEDRESPLASERLLYLLWSMEKVNWGVWGLDMRSHISNQSDASLLEDSEHFSHFPKRLQRVFFLKCQYQKNERTKMFSALFFVMISKHPPMLLLFCAAYTEIKYNFSRILLKRAIINLSLSCVSVFKRPIGPLRNFFPSALKHIIAINQSLSLE